MQRKKRLLLSLALLAVFIPTALGAIVLSNMLSSTFTVSDSPFVIGWVGANPNSANILKNNQYVYNISVHNVSPDIYTYQNSTLVVKIIPPSPINSADSSQSSPIWLLQAERSGLGATPAHPTTLGNVLTYKLTLPSELSFGAPINPGQTIYVVIYLTFRDSAPVGQYTIQASVSSD
jgi:hypothetical protein